MYSAGFVGRAIDANISNSFSTGTVVGKSFTAGFAGLFNRTTATNCYSRASASGAQYVGGFLGSSYDSDVSKCYSIGAVKSEIPSGGGGLVGTGNSTPTSSFWDTQTSTTSTSKGGVGKSTSAMKSQGTFSDWDFTNVWSISSGEYPTFKWEDIHQITFSEIGEKRYGDADFKLIATSSEGLTVSFAIDAVSAVNLNGDMVTILKPGSAKVTASQDGNGTVAAAKPVIRTLTILKGTPHGIEWPAKDTIILGDAISTVDLSSATSVTPGDFSILDAQSTPSVEGLTSAKVVFTPTEVDLYENDTSTVEVFVKDTNGTKIVMGSEARGKNRGLYISQNPVDIDNGSVGVVVITGEAADIKLKIYDNMSNLLESSSTLSITGTGSQFKWDLRNSAGNLVTPGTYIIRAKLTYKKGGGDLFQRAIGITK